MLVYLLYMLVFLAKEEQLLSQQVSVESFTCFNLPMFIYFNCILPLFTGLTSAEPFGPVYLSALASAGPDLIPGHSGIC